ncbi:MAG: penicillin-binding protein 2 [bacterium]|nr:penicillin-binding protein 2 [bacterium]
MEKYLRNKKVKMRFKEDIEPQEVLLDSLAQKREEEFGISEKKIEVPLSKKVLSTFYIVFLILILILFAKTFQLQLLNGEKLSALAEENKFIIYSIQATRGVIYDKDGNQLVFNKPSFDLACIDAEKLRTCLQQDFDSSLCPELKTLEEVSLIIKRDIGELKEEIEKSELPTVIFSKNLDHQTLILLEAKIASNELPGFQIERNFVRDYKEGPSFAHLIGYIGEINAEELKADPENYSIFDYVGKTGLEKFYEEILRKNSGKLRLEKDALGNIISKEIIQLPGPGKSLALWLDSDLQKKIEEELGKVLKNVGAQKAAAVALDPKTGGVLSLVSLPSFDNNLFQKGADPQVLQDLLEDPSELKPFFNRVIAGRYLIGSTIKPLIASAALEEKIISPDKKINDNQGFITIPNPWDPSSPTIKKDWMIHGWTDMRKAIAESCNVYFYTVGGGYGDQEGLGPTRIKKYLQLFGWGEETGIDLPGEATGFIPDKEWKKETWGQGWWDGDTYNLSIGQGYLEITPLEVATGLASIANGGKLFQPQVVQKIVDTSEGSEKIVKEMRPEIIRENFIDPENLQIVREGMREAVTYGSSVILNSLPVKAASKTGTAELGCDSYGNCYYHNWVTVFAPYDDPQIVLTIVIEDVKGMQAAALPVAKEVLEWYFTK